MCSNRRWKNVIENPNWGHIFQALHYQQRSIVILPHPHPCPLRKLAKNATNKSHANKTQDNAYSSPATRNRTRDHLIAAVIYSQMLYQLSYSRR